MTKNRIISVFSHVLVWAVLFSMPYLLSTGQSQDITRIIAHFWIPLVLSAMLFYANYFVLIDRFYFTKKIIAFVGVNALFITVFLLLREYLESNYFQELARRTLASDDDSGSRLKMFIYGQIASYMAPLLFAIAVKTTERWVTTEAERKETANIKLQSELQHLHYQLQPHFFFNSLNNIYAMVDVSPDEAKKSIHSLSKLMRYMLYETNMEVVPLTKEIDFMKKYIDLMKLRVSDKTKVNYNFPSEDTGIQVAPLLFVSLIENAFKHGVSGSKESTIQINLVIVDKRVLFTIENDNFPKKSDDKSGSGIGLVNIEKRLALLYPQRSELSTEVRDNRFVAQLEILTD